MKATAENEPIRMARLAAIHRADRAHYKLLDTVDELTSVGGAIGRGVGGREVSLAITNLEQAEMWLARALWLAREDLNDETE